MTDIHVPRENEPGEYYGHPAVYIGPRGNPGGRSWAVYVADGGAHDRHTVMTLVDTEEDAEAIAADFIGKRRNLFSAFHQLSSSFPPPFHLGKSSEPTESKGFINKPVHFCGKDKYMCVFARNH